MNPRSYRLEFITPCFCAGADQARAEVRVPSLRGELRWWFRVLGGRPEQEKAVFGGVHGDQPRASAVICRIRNRNLAPIDEATLPRQNQSLYYLFHFAKGRGCLAPGSGFELMLSTRRQTQPESEALLERAITAFCRLGALGLRQTRGLGAFAAKDHARTLEEFREWARSLRPRIKIVCIAVDGQPVVCETGREALCLLESCLRGLRTNMPAGREGTNPTPLGRGGRQRQASSVRLRPVKLADGSFLPVVCQVESVLGHECRKPLTLAGFAFGHPWPAKGVPKETTHQLIEV